MIKTYTLSVNVDLAPRLNGKEFEKYCDKYGFYYINSSRRAWCDEFKTYFRNAVGIATTKGDVRFLIYEDDLEGSEDEKEEMNE